MEDNKNEILASKMEKIISVSGYEKYQNVLFLLLFFYYACINTFRQSLPYLIKMPTVLINNTNYTINDTICNDPSFDKNKINPDYSWIEEFETYCDKSKSIWFVYCYYAGCLLGISLLFCFNNTYLINRKKNLIFSGFAFSFVLLISNFINSYEGILIFTALFGALYSIAFISTISISVESNATCRRAFYTILIMCASPLIGIVSGISFKYTGYWRLNFSTIAGINLIVLILLIFFCIESPRIFLSKKDLNNFFKILFKIAKFNNREDKFNYIFDTEEIETKSKVASQEFSETLVVSRHLDEKDEVKMILKEITKKFNHEINDVNSNNLSENISALSCKSVKNRESVRELIILSFLWFCTFSVGYNQFFINFIIQYNNSISFELVYILHFLAEILLTFIFWIMLERKILGRRRTMIIGHVICFILCLSIIFLEIGSESQSYHIICLISNLFLKVTKNVLTLYSTEVYSTNDRLKYLSVNWFFGSLGIYASNFIYSMKDQSIIYFYAIDSIISITLIVFLTKETLKKYLIDIEN